MEGQADRVESGHGRHGHFIEIETSEPWKVVEEEARVTHGMCERGDVDPAAFWLPAFPVS